MAEYEVAIFTALAPPYLATEFHGVAAINNGRLAFPIKSYGSLIFKRFVFRTYSQGTASNLDIHSLKGQVHR
jgi:hypothetical protein